MAAGPLLAACAAEGPSEAPATRDDDVATRAPAPPPAKETTGATVTAPSPPSTPLAFTCRKDAFCDDFEDAAPGTRWQASGAVDFVGPSSTLGDRAMRARVGAGASPAFLRLVGKQVAHHWAGALGLSLMVDALPLRAVGGPEIVVPTSTAGGAVGARLSIVVVPDGIQLEQRAAGCDDSACASRTDRIAPVRPGEWSRIVIGVEATEGAGAPFGRVEVSLDGGDNANLPLVVLPLGGNVEVRAGIARADDADASLRVDDVMFFTR